MKKWMVRGKLNKEALKKANKYLVKEFSKCEDGQFLYFHESLFGFVERGTIFKTKGAAKGKETIAKDMKKSGVWHFYVEDIEVIEVEVVIPGEK